MRRNVKQLVTVGVAAVLVGVAVVTYANRDAVFDWWQLRNYTPPAAIVELADDTAMTPKARTLFYINHPALEGATPFNTDCPIGSEHTIVLGCYHADERGIFLFSVTDKTLAGVEQVTAAHETLHAAYSRLSLQEKQYVDGLLEDYYQHDLHDPTILAEIAAYKKSEPNDVVNEMHSVFGTEISNLPPALEQYYKQYFTDRKKITQYATDYRGAFSSRATLVKKYDARLTAGQTAINAGETTLNTELQSVQSQQAELDALRSAGDNAAYNNGVSGYNASVDKYNALVAMVRDLISEYNALVVKRNAVALQENHLAQELNSKAQTIGQ